jgi:8-oxo-dGTP diphosphatase
MSNRPGVGIGVLIWKDGKILIGQRKGSHAAGTWSAPGGWIEYGETFEEAAKREALEETGIEVSNIRHLCATNNLMPNDNLHTITVWMECYWLTGEPTLTEPDKFIEHRWCDPHDLPKNLFVALSELKRIKPEIFK